MADERARNDNVKVRVQRLGTWVSCFIDGRAFILACMEAGCAICDDIIEMNVSSVAEEHVG